MYHSTTVEAAETILREGLKINQQDGFSIGSLVYMREAYEVIPIFLSTQPGTYAEPGSVTLKVDVSGLDLVADIPSLVDYGAYLTDEDSLYFSDSDLKGGYSVFPENEVDFSELTYPGTSESLRAIGLTKTAAYLNNIEPGRISVEEGIVSRIVKAFDYLSLISDQRYLEKFLNKQGLKVEDLTWAGEGYHGTAYHAKDRILKITNSSDEFRLAKRLLQGSYSSLVKVFAAEPVPEFGLVILQEELQQPPDIETLFWSLQEVLEEEGIDLNHLDYLDEEDLNISGELREFILEMYGIILDLRKLGVANPDIHPENLGRNKEGNLKLFDIDERK